MAAANSSLTWQDRQHPTGSPCREPWRYLPYLFLGAVLIGIAISVSYARSSDSNPVPDSSDTRI